MNQSADTLLSDLAKREETHAHARAHTHTHTHTHTQVHAGTNKLREIHRV